MPRTPNARPGDDIVVRVRDLTTSQKAYIDDIVGPEWRHGDILKEGASFIEASVATLDALMEDLDFKLGDDHAMNVAGGSLKDLSDHQVAMAVSNIEKCLTNTISKINQAIVKQAQEDERLKTVMAASGTAISKAVKAAITNEAETITVSAEGGTVNDDGSLTVPKVTPLPELDAFFAPEPKATPAKHRERMVRYDVMKCFDLAFFATEDHASAFESFVLEQGDKYRLPGLEHMPCGREKHLDVAKLNLFAVSCKGR